MKTNTAKFLPIAERLFTAYNRIANQNCVGYFVLGIPSCWQ